MQLAHAGMKAMQSPKARELGVPVASSWIVADTDTELDKHLYLWPSPVRSSATKGQLHMHTSATSNDGHCKRSGATVCSAAESVYSADDNAHPDVHRGPNLCCCKAQLLVRRTGQGCRGGAEGVEEKLRQQRVIWSACVQPICGRGAGVHRQL
jgi:hypothetical protein